MEQDHYSVLGVSQEADQATMRAAYFRRAQQWHPDRGGSHAQMKRLNEAWYILSDTQRRAHYDAVLRGGADARSQAHSREDARAARAAAEQYPADWAEFQRWFQSVAQDFQQARYGESWDSLEISNSRSGKAFVKVGMGCGIIAGAYVLFTSPAPFYVRLRGAFFFAIVGALLGKGLHYLIRSALPHAGTISEASVASPAAANQSSKQPPVTEPKIPDIQFVICQGCGRTLRLPESPPSDVVKCPACGRRFSLRAAR